jgi:hypothetical protein
MKKLIRMRQMLLDLTSRAMEERVHKLKSERERMEEERAKEKEPANSMENFDLAGRQVKKESRISGFKVLGVFTLCGLLASLGWGGVISVLVITSKVWPV